MVLTQETKSWISDICEKIVDKESRVIKKSGDKIPYTTINGVFDDKFAEDPFWWTNGFWEGILWLMRLKTGDLFYGELADRLEARMDAVLYDPEGLYHDVGFMWLLSSVANYRITGSAASRKRGLTAANTLASRFNPSAGFITAWNGKDKEGWSIIDCMMNLPLLYWAGSETGYERYNEIATAHADKTLNHVIRPDGSVIHIIEYDRSDGSVVRTLGGQGFGENSSWTRGQSWALYGFVISYLRTGEQKYLDAAKKVAHYFIAAVASTGYVPPVDFRCPQEPALVDTTAGAVAAGGLIEISKLCEYDGDMYLDAALKILMAIEGKYADWSGNCDAILRYGTEAYHNPAKKHIDIIYGDYFFIEALFKLGGLDFIFW